MSRVARAPWALLALLVGCATPPTEPAPPPTEAITEAAAVSPAAPLAPLARSFRTIVVDAGHGGEDRGAVGISGVTEKDVTLATARRVAAALRGRGLTVVETRTADVTVPLSRRTELANASGAGLFVSLHANSAPDSGARGIETYSMDLTSDESGMRLAERENRAAELLEQAAGLPRREDDQIVAELEHGANAGWSRAFATQVHGELLTQLRDHYGRTTIVDRRRRAAPFWVLLDAEVPAILIEIGYLTDAEEEQRLRTRAWQDRVGEAVADGVLAFIARAEEAEAGAPPDVTAGP